MKENKKRFSIPSRLVELLYVDDNFFSEVLKLKKAEKAVVAMKFPRSDEWRDESGFNLSFALAGYSVDDVRIEYYENNLVITGNGIDGKVSDEELDGDYVKDAKPRIHQGYITRGIARRKFSVNYVISEEFDVSNATAVMEYGLLHILIPEKETVELKEIEIKNGRL